MSNISYKRLAFKIIDFCMDNGLWQDTTVYVDGYAFTDRKEWDGINGIMVEPNLFKYWNKNPLDYFEYANPNTVSMSFEGPLYRVINCYFENENWFKLYDEFCAIFDKYGMYFEQGHAWNLSVYED